MEASSLKEPKPKEPLHFRQEVSIKGLPYVFEGDIPQEPADFEWSISVPNWEEQKPKVEAMIKDAESNSHHAGINPRYVIGLESYGLGNGRVGILQMKRVDPKDKTLAIGVSHVQTETMYLPEEFGYNQAEGIGSFLLDNLCTLADIEKWRIYLFPDDRGGKLRQDQIYKWYLRRGFDDEYKFPKESRDNFGSMQRWPKQPDLSQPIAAILQPTS